MWDTGSGEPLVLWYYHSEILLTFFGQNWAPKNKTLYNKLNLYGHCLYNAGKTWTDMYLHLYERNKGTNKNLILFLLLYIAIFSSLM
jgi:hypothetical protein